MQKKHTVYMPSSLFKYFRRSRMSTITALLLGLFLLDIHTGVDSHTFNVRDFGAVGDGLKDDTEAFVMAWNSTCNTNASSSTMVIPRGSTFPVSQISFTGPCKSPITVQLGGELKAPSGTERWKGKDPSKWLEFEGIDGLFVDCTFSLLDGQGQHWWDKSCRYHPGQVLRFTSCKNVKVTRLSIVNSPQTHVLVFNSQNVSLDNVFLKSPETSPNTDGVHIAASANVSVRGSIIESGDDCISIGDQTSNVNVTFLNCGPGHGVSVGSLGRDGDVVNVTNIYVKHVNFTKTTNGARIKTWQVGRGEVRNVQFSYLNFDQVRNPIIIDQYYCNVSGACAKSNVGVHLSDLVFSHASGTSATPDAVIFNCSNVVPCTNVVLDTVELQSSSASQPLRSACNFAHGSAQGTCQPPSCLQP